ncbi:helix-turn-helix transcriptional regulator [Salinibaculum salinum]|uniref:helix-turn-helix transcriptional regulator n=1 Tax=Salinibaculum salinum TaxID=3131996 RepID=UPI0030ED1D5F
MSKDADAIDHIAFLARSESRVRILERLLEAGPLTQRELRECVDASRSTVTRTLTDLQGRNWVAKAGNGYRLTATGESITERFLDLVSSVRTTEELSSFLRWFPTSEFELDMNHMRGADVTPSTDSDPYAPGRRQTEFLQRVDEFRGFLPSIDIQGTRVVHEQIMNGAFEAEIVVSANVGDRITSGEFARLFREQLDTGRLTVYVAEEPLPFYLGLGGETVQIGVEDDEGFPRALLETDASPVVPWGEDVYDTYRARANEQSAESFER